MRRLSSYQRRKRDTKFLQQCINELEEIAKDLVKSKGKVRLFGSGLTGEEWITPYNNGDFGFELIGLEKGAA